MKRHLRIVALRVAIAAVSIPLMVTSGATWRLETLCARLKTKLSNLETTGDGKQ